MRRIALRPARLADAGAIAELVKGYADAGVMLPRTIDEIALAIDDYIVAVNARGRVIACGALTQYSPSVAEVSSIAVARTAQRRGLGRRVVARVEQLARARGYDEVFLVTVTPAFFAALGYAPTSAESYPEKRAASACGGAAIKTYMHRALHATRHTTRHTTPRAMEIAA